MTRILLFRPLDEAECDLVFGLAVGGDTVPVPLDHLGKLLVTASGAGHFRLARQFSKNLRAQTSRL